MTLVQVVGYAAALLLLASFAMRSITWLRYLAIASAVVLAIYGIIAMHYPVLAIAVVMAGLNLWRLAEMQRLIGAARAATAGAGAPVTVDWLLPHMQAVSLPKGHVLFRRGDVADSMYFISSGRIGLDELGVEVGKGNLFGEIGVFSVNNIRTATATCVEPCSLLQVSADRMRELFFENPEFAFFLVGIITRRLVEDLEKAKGGARA